MSTVGARCHRFPHTSRSCGDFPAVSLPPMSTVTGTYPGGTTPTGSSIDVERHEPSQHTAIPALNRLSRVLICICVDWNGTKLSILTAYNQAFNDLYAGQTLNRMRYHLLPPGMEPMESKDHPEKFKPDYHLHLIKLVA